MEHGDRDRSGARLLIVAGHDPSGGAGVDADREAVQGLQVQALCVVTAFTDQDDRAVRSIGARDPGEWLREALELAREPVAAVKIGLLPGAEHVRAAHDLVRALRERHGADLPVVLDPVLRASSGSRFLDEAGTEALRGGLVTDGVILTPNLHEAAELACHPAGELRTSLAARMEVARILLALGAAAVVIKAGHGDEDPARDLVAFPDGRHSWLAHARVPGGKLRGSGCRFASRLAAGLALGRALEESAEEAGCYVTRRILAARAGPA